MTPARYGLVSFFATRPLVAALDHLLPRIQPVGREGLADERGAIGVYWGITGLHPTVVGVHRARLHWPSVGLTVARRRSTMIYVVVMTVAFIASGLTFFSGFGLGTLLLPAFALFFPAEHAVAPERPRQGLHGPPVA